MYALPKETEWIIYLNTDTKGWGQYSYKTALNKYKFTVPIEKAIESELHGYDVYYLKAKILHALGRKKEALQTVKKAKHKVPQGHKNSYWLYRTEKTIADWNKNK